MTTEAPRLYPAMRYNDCRAAIAFLCEAFGFTEQVVHEGEGDTIAHAQLSYGPSVLMLGTDRDTGHGLRAGTGWLYVAVDDPDAHCERARAAGAEILAEPFEQEYGSRDYQARDPEGNLWSFGTYRPGPEGAA